MPITDREGQAKRLLPRFYIDGNTRVAPSEVQTRLGISEATLYNYVGYMKEFDLVKHVPSATGARKNDIELTDKGKGIMERGEIPAPRHRSRNVSVSKRQITLQSLYDDAQTFMKENPSWIVDITPRPKSKEDKEVASQR